MKKVEDYRQHAAECRLMANRVRSSEERDMLTNMSRTWEALAADREAHIARQKRLAALEHQTGDKEKLAGSIPIDQLNAANDE